MQSIGFCPACLASHSLSDLIDARLGRDSGWYRCNEAADCNEWWCGDCCGECCSCGEAVCQSHCSEDSDGIKCLPCVRQDQAKREESEEDKDEEESEEEDSSVSDDDAAAAR